MRVLIAAWVFSILLHPLGAAEATLTLDLSRVEEIALKNNPHILQAQAELKAAGRRPNQALAPHAPMLMLGVSGMDQGPLALDRAARASVMWDQQWDFPGKSLVRRRAELARVQGAQAMLREARLEALWHARAAFWEYCYKREVQTLRAQARKQWAFFEQTMTSRGLSGQWLSVKRVKTQMALARAANEDITASQQVEVATAHLNHQLGQPMGTRYQVDTKQALPAFDQDQGPLLSRALDRHPALAAGRAQVDMASAESLAAGMAFLPDLTTRLEAMGPYGGDKMEYAARVGIQVPLGLGESLAVSEKAALKEAAQHRLEAIRYEVAHAVEEAYVTAKSAWRILELYEKGKLVRQADKAWKFAQGAWQGDSLSLDDYMEAYEDWLDIQLAWHRARADYGRALSNLEYVTGTLPQGEQK